MTQPDDPAARSCLRAALLFVGAVAAVRIIFLFLSPLELYPDEAQYWVWSRHLSFGYFSKPPMIAWLIRATTALGGEGEAWIRLSAPLLHGAAAMALFAAGQRLYNARTGLWACVLYTLIPGVTLSSAIIATDAPLLMFVALGVWTYAGFSTAIQIAARRRFAAGLGLAIGFAFLTKYAALYLVGGIALHAVASSAARRRWDLASILITIGLGLLVASPNIVWNLTHHFQTVMHTAENADIGSGDKGLKGLFGARGPFGFVLGQLGVFGPIAFVVLLIGAVRVFRRQGSPEDRLLLCLAAPAFIVVFAEAIVARANANWAAAAYAPGILLVAALLVRWSAWRWLGAAIAFNAAFLLGFVTCVLTPGLADTAGMSNALKRARGWRADTAAILSAATRANAAAPLSAVAVDDRFLFNALAYYGRDQAGRPAGALPAPLKAWVHLAGPANQAEAQAPLTAGDGRHVLAVSAIARFRPAFVADFQSTLPATPPALSIALDPGHQRTAALFIGEGFRPQPRDPITGLPTP